MADQSSAIQDAMQLPPRVTSTHVYFLGESSGHHLDCLSQWYECRFSEFKDRSEWVPNYGDHHLTEFRTTEQYMMLRKAMLMRDVSTALKILHAETPLQAKALGRQVSSFDRVKWKEHCDQVVERGNWLKFAQNEELKKHLLDTGDRVLVEAHPEDRIWGVGWNNDEAEGKESDWGENRLGKALMKVRTRLENGETWEEEVQRNEATRSQTKPKQVASMYTNLSWGSS